MSSLVLTALLLSTQALQSSPSCSMAMDDRQWIEGLIQTWRDVARTSLRIDPDPLPVVITFDRACVWRIGAADGTPHSGTIQLPDGGTAAAALGTVAGTSGPEHQPYVAMPMPSLWRAEPRHQAEANLPLLMRAVFVHEMAHAMLAPALGPWLSEIEQRLKLPGGFDRDIIQTHFEKDPEFRAAWAAERSLLYQAANEPIASVRRALLSTAVSAMTARRSRFFTGEQTAFAELEDVSLIMEGLGSWVAYQVALGEPMSPVDAQSFVRRARDRWSSAEGFAAFLLIDALLPNWRDRVLQGRPASLLTLLAEAARR